MGVVLTYKVQGKPRLTDIKFQGNTKFKDAKLLKKISSKVGEPLDERKLFTDSQEIQKLYQSKGYPGTQVKYVLNIDENAGRGTATFAITEESQGQNSRREFCRGEGLHAEEAARRMIREFKTRRHWMCFLADRPRLSSRMRISRKTKRG